MANLKRPAVLLIALWTVVIGIGVVPDFIRTAGALGAWDVVVAALFTAFLLATILWLGSVWIQRPAGFVRWGWMVCLALSLTALGAHVRRPSLAEAALHRFGITPQKRGYSGMHSWLLKKLGIRIEFREVWSTDNPWPVDGIPTQDSLDQSMALLSIFRPKHLTLTCREGVHSMEPLRRLKSLKHLIIHVKSSPDCNALAELPELETLNVGAALNAIDLRALVHAPKLNYLAVAGVSWEETGSYLPESQTLLVLSIDGAPHFACFTSGLALPNLNRLILSRTSPHLDLAGLADFAPKLNSLTFGYCDQSVDFKPLDRLSNLESLSFQHPGRTVLPFPQLNALVNIDFRKCEIPSLSGLADSAPNLESIYIENQSATLSFDGMERFAKLRRLAVFDCPIDIKPEHIQLGKRLEYFVTPRPRRKSSGDRKPGP